MANSDVLSEGWSKVNEGMVQAGLLPQQRQLLMDQFNAIKQPDRAREAITVGGYGVFASSDRDAKGRRDLFRAYHFACYLRGHAQNLRVAVDQDQKAAFSHQSKSIDHYREVTRLALLDLITPKVQLEDPKTLPPIPVIPVPQPVAPTPVTPAVKQYDQAVAAKWRGLVKKVSLQNQVAKAFQHEGQQRNDRMQQYLYQQRGALFALWNQSINDIRHVFNQQQTWQMHNFTVMNSAVSNAFEGYHANVKDAQKELQAKLEMAAKLFSALSAAPPPINLIGMIGSQIVGVLHVDSHIDPRRAYEPIKRNESKLMQKIGEKLEQFRAATRVGQDLGALNNQQSLAQTLESVCSEQLKVLQQVLNEACTEHFGADSQTLDSYEAFVSTVTSQNAATLMGRIGDYSATQTRNSVGQQSIENLIKQQITAHKTSLINLIKTTLDTEPAHVPFDDMYEAVSLYLHCSYVSNQFPSGVSVLDRISGLGRPMIAFFEKDNDWGVTINTSSHEDARSHGRLKYQGHVDHIEALLNFCRWYTQHINPFYMVAGVMVPEGDQASRYDAAFIQRKIRERILYLNTKIEEAKTIRQTVNWRTVG